MRNRQGLSIGKWTIAEHKGGTMKVGWDWADKTHHVTVIDDNGAVVDAFGADHNTQSPLSFPWRSSGPKG